MRRAISEVVTEELLARLTQVETHMHELNKEVVGGPSGKVFPAGGTGPEFKTGFGHFFRINKTLSGTPW
jgi:hypothetical protein